MIKRKNRIYFIFLSLLSVLILFFNNSVEEFLLLKFLIPNNIFYFLITILFIYLENLYIVEELRKMMELKEYIIIRLKRKDYKKKMLISLLETLIIYFIYNILWCLLIVGMLPLKLLIFDIIIKIILIVFVSKYYMRDYIYFLLLLMALLCKFIASLVF